MGKLHKKERRGEFRSVLRLNCIYLGKKTQDVVFVTFSAQSMTRRAKISVINTTARLAQASSRQA